MTGRPVARVLLDAPLPQLDRLFDYAIPEVLADQVTAGIRVRVPLRSAGRMVDAFVVEVGTADAPDRPLSDIDSVTSTAQVLTPGLYALARRVADRAAGSASDVLRLAIPKRMVRVEKAWLAAPAPVAPVIDPAAQTRADTLLGTYAGLSEALDADERLALDAPPRVTSTGSGEDVGSWAVLLAAAAAHTLAGGRSAIIAVPDHRDLDQLERALHDFVPAEAIVRDDAGRPAPERYRSFLRTLGDAPAVVIGNRSAVYAPAAAVGLVAIWDDGDPLLDEPLAPYAHTRDAALIRRELDGGALLFAGHTRTTDVQRLVEIGFVREVATKRRETPRVVLSAQHETERPGVRLPSAAFRAAREALASGPVLVQVSRPGYAPVLVCAECRQPARCANCAGPLHVARQGATPACTWCGLVATTWTCPHCSSTKFRLASSGSQRTADELGRAFPGVRVILADGDHPVLRVDDRPALVVATRGAEPIAAGGYRAVVLLDGERMLLSDALRIGESCVRWWSNAAALAAPDAPVHLVGVVGPAARALATWNQPAYARSQLDERAPLHMPPIVRVALLEGQPAVVDRALEELRTAVPELPESAILGPVLGEARVPGPQPLPGGAPVARALVRFEYSRGAAVTGTLRASLIAASLRNRRPPRGNAVRNTLKVRVDVPDPEL